METIESIFTALENKVKEINVSIKLTFGNTNLMKQQLRHIILCKEQLNEIKLNLEELIKSTDKNTKFPIIPAALGALLTLVGGTTSAFGVDLTIEAIQHHTSEKERRENLRQRCISLQKNVEEIIQTCETLQLVADKSFGNREIMQYLIKKKMLKNCIELIGNTVFWLIFFIFTLLLIYSIILLFRFELGGLLVALIFTGFTAALGSKVAEYVSSNEKQWKMLLNDIAHNCHNK
ncbi:hypothetical protein [Nostoc sp. MS1]|uniref:hypothetical protein n=1 Tax=Nostoc sp. MS1 TaxID=2764711 RepID=UPI001CC7410A|nr:hypothetical protein [Nostoc sp. MS1]BCL36075.1 hypothetical protein NSMS1_25220 [Nostoc sp. MS1]